jgi:hypothetical protein
VCGGSQARQRAGAFYDKPSNEGYSLRVNADIILWGYFFSKEDPQRISDLFKFGIEGT